MNKIKISKTFATVFLPIFFAFIAVLSYGSQIEREYIVDDFVEKFAMEGRDTEAMIDRYLSEITETLNLIKNSDEMKSYVKLENENTYKELVAMFARVMNSKSNYYQIRYIDDAGMEIAKLKSKDSKIEIIGAEELQDKSSRYYFEESRDINDGETYISRLDLNMENGVIEKPIQPVIRLAVPLYDSAKVRKGILMVNYKAEYLFEILNSNRLNFADYNFNFSVINKNGEYIINSDENKNFSFAFEKLEELNFAEDRGEEWGIVNKNNNGFIRKNDKLITYYDVLATTREKNPNYKEKWIVIHDKDITDLSTINMILDKLGSYQGRLVSGLIFILSLIVAVFFEKLRNKNSQIELTQKIADSANDGVLITDENTAIIYVNKAYEEITGYKLEEIVGIKPNDLKSGKHDEGFYEKMWHNINKYGHWEGMIWDKKKNGVLYPQKMKIIAIKDRKKAKVKNYISIFRDMSLDKNNSMRVEKLNYSNDSVLIPNEDMMYMLLEKTVNNEDFKFMVLCIAIENYNQLVTFLDEFENKSSEIFINLLQPMIADEDFVAQTGKNVFAAIINMKNLDKSPQRFVEEVNKELSQIINLDGKDLFLKIKIGVSFWPTDANDIKKLFLNSLIALESTYSEKSSSVAFFSENMIKKMNRENEIEKYLRSAIDRNEFYMVYQPQVDLDSGEVIGMEALIRWDNEKLGIVPPGLFIPIAERTNYIIELTYWIIERVCKDLSDMHSKMPDKFDKIRCAINISAVHIQEKNFLDEFSRILLEYGIDANKVEIEITEGVLISNEEKTIDILNEFRNKGVKISIDDFGTGYSSLSYLNRLPIDKIKIDRSFIKNYPKMDDGKIAKILVNMVKSLDLDVLIEGAETEEQIQFLRKLGCMYIQGYYYSKPLDKDKLIEYLQ